MIVSLIVAMDEAGGISLDGRLPWRLSSDLQRFKALTMGHHLVMGRKTFDSIGRPLPGRTTIIVTRQLNYHPAGCLVANSLEIALELARGGGESEVFVIGGGEIYAQSLPCADRIYLTCVHTRVAADTFFPAFDPSEWEAVQVVESPVGEKDQFPYTFTVMQRR